MKITDLAAFGRINRHFENGDFKQGTVNELPIYVYKEGKTREKDLTPGHFVYAMKNSNMSFNLETFHLMMNVLNFFLLIMIKTRVNIVMVSKTNTRGI